MKRIDFSNVNIEMELGVFQTRDTRSEFGNIVFQHAATLEQDTLARKIFNAPTGELTELADGEFDMLTAAMRASGYRYSVIRDLEAADQSKKPKETEANE